MALENESPTLDVSELNDREMAAVVILAGPRAVSAATGLSVAYLLALAPSAGETTGRELRAFACPSCDHPRSAPPKTGHERCTWCVRGAYFERQQRAASVLAAGLRGTEAKYAVMDAERCSWETAERLLARGRRGRPELGGRRVRTTRPVDAPTAGWR